jgi:hypothetical protein
MNLGVGLGKVIVAIVIVLTVRGVQMLLSRK